MKIVIAGAFGVGKTTLVQTVSETRPLHTEEVMTRAGELVDDLHGIRDKTGTTVALDFGRRTLPGDLVLYLFGAPGQRRFLRLWQEIAHGALGVLVLVDTRRLDASFEVLDLIEEAGTPYAVAVNTFPDSPAHSLDVIRDHLDLAPHTPLVGCDARDADSAVDALIALVSYLIAHTTLDAAP
ncbi:ATP/GTP-binding protein [Streptomyces sp. XD-27]|uniref:GTP-binding protein n=1 Tax=Streptomyces sp. XD-27 TaxID=3062779 RepID=UPI0026F40C2A|nr:ATP/GTP-binding protein [Streptomyces sp. XD-27]WKX74450.1 ATP/GTP-binding protein [Streptomyces sp. XD-27]